MTRTCRNAVLAVVVSCIGACGPTKTVGSRYVASRLVNAANGDSIAVSAADSPELAGTVLKIPPGALADNTQITLELGEGNLTRTGTRAAGPVAIFGPSGTKFSKPVELTLPFAHGWHSPFKQLLPVGQATPAEQVCRQEEPVALQAVHWPLEHS